MLRTLLPIILLTFIFSFAQAQTDQLTPYMVMQVDLAKLDQNMSMEKLKSMDLFNDLFTTYFPKYEKDGEMQRLNLDEIGLSNTGKITMVAYPTEEGSAFATKMPITNKAGFESYYEEAIGNINEEAELGSYENYALSPWSGGTYMAWNETSVINFSADKTWGASDYEDLSWEEMQSIEEAFVMDQLEAYLSGASAAGGNKSFSGTGAIQVWGDYGAFAEKMMGSTMGMGMGAPGMESLSGIYDMLYSGMEMNLDVNFLMGKAKVDMDLKMPDNYPDIKSFTNGKINKKFKKYINGNNLVGLYSFAFEPETYFEAMKPMMYDIFDGIPEMMGLGREVAGLMGMFIDEEAIYNFFKGDVLVAFTGVQQFENIVTTYQYDDDFNAIEILDTVNSQLPQFTAMLSYGDEVNMRRIMSIGEKLGVLMPANKNYYEIAAPTGGTFYLGTYDDILFISNDVALMTQKLTTGWGGNAVGGDIWKSVKKNSIFGFWDVPRTVQLADENGMPVGEEMVNMSKESLRHVKMVSPRNQSGSYKTSFTFDFVNQKTNALELMVNFINNAFFNTGNQNSL